MGGTAGAERKPLSPVTTSVWGLPASSEAKIVAADRWPRSAVALPCSLPADFVLCGRSHAPPSLTDRCSYNSAHLLLCLLTSCTRVSASPRTAGTRGVREGPRTLLRLNASFRKLTASGAASDREVRGNYAGNFNPHAYNFPCFFQLV